MSKLKYFPILFSIAIAVSSAPFAQAISFDFTSDHVTGGAGTPPFGTVTLTQSGANVDFTVTLAAGYKFVKTGSADFQYFKFNGTGVALGDIININQNFAGFTLSRATGAFNGDGTGNFTFGITSNHGNGGSPPQYLGPISFTVANATIADLTVPNNLGNVFVADILAPNGHTGPVDASTPNSVPDGGATVMLLGAALGALGMARRFLKC
jgi:hypothetical protein